MMVLSPVPGSPADAPHSVGSSPSVPVGPPSVDYYAETKEKLGGMCMDDGDVSMLLCSPTQSRPFKRNRVGTPSGKTPISCASTAVANDDESDDGESLIPKALRMPAVEASPVPRALFSASNETHGGGMAPKVSMKNKNTSGRRQALAPIAPATSNVNPFAPEPLTRVDSVETHSRLSRMDSMESRSESTESMMMRRSDSIDKSLLIVSAHDRQCPPPPQAKRTSSSLMSGFSRLYPRMMHRRQQSMEEDSIGSLSQESQDSMYSSKRAREERSSVRQRSRFQHDFEVLKAIGSGSFGTVHKVKSRLDGLMYAVKSTRAKFKSEAHRDRMLAEVYALAALSNDRDHCGASQEGAQHIVRYYQAWLEDGRLFIQTELCDSSLERELVRGRIERTPKAVYTFLRQMLLALDLLHLKQLVHLDIKPGNIFVNRGPRGPVYKLGDFGLVARAQKNKETSKMYEDVTEGDSRYMPRELLNDLKRLDLTKCDIFSLGATAYELILATQLPANGPDWHALRDGQLAFPQSLLNSSPSLTHVISRLMKPDPVERPSAATLLHQEPEFQSQVQQLAMTVCKLTNQLNARQEIPKPNRLARSNTWA